jgi:endonuclease I
MYGITGTIDVFDGQIESVYTAASVAPDGTRTPGGTFNTEHSWPRSDGADVEPPLSDIHHLFPCDEPSNTERASYPFGETTCEAAACPWSDDGSELGPDGEGRTVFEVRGARRGDVARAHFYFAVRYALAIESAEESTLRAWHIEDPPDAREQARNDRIEAVQANRNPFVDCPELVDDLLDL